jgi:NADP-dependent 3-hydroxy acid dehydrogenase YdfG
MEWNRKIYLVYGATGGLGRAVTQVLKARGVTVIAGGRSPEKLAELAGTEGLTEKPFIADLNDPAALEAAGRELMQRISRLDGIIVAAGHDVRKLHHDMTDADILGTVSVNLTGIAFLARMILPVFQKQGTGTLAVIGGFGDGRLAFPGHALDAASRAGVFTLLEGLRRENPLLNFLYFCPPAVDTAAERPWFPLWKKLGVRIITPGKAAEQLIRVLSGKEHWHMTGSAFDRFGIRLNAWDSTLADKIFMNGMSRTIIKFLKQGSHQ